MRSDEGLTVFIMIIVSLVLLTKQCRHDACIDNCSVRKFASADEARVCFMACRQGGIQ